MTVRTHFLTEFYVLLTAHLDIFI